MTTAPSKPPMNGAPKTKAPPPPPPTTARAPMAAPKTSAPKIGRLEETFQPPRMIVNAVEGWGKTTLAAHAPKPLILMAGGETGYATLLGAGRVPSVDAAKCTTWAETLALCDELIANFPGYGLIALDAMNGFERQCHEHVCQRDFGGDWGEQGFTSFQKGYEVAINDWLQLLQRLDRLQAAGAMILFLSHCKIRTFKNPLGPDYDRWGADCHEKTWAVTAKWADDVFFGNFFTVVEGGKTGAKPRKGKGIGGTDRILYTERRDAYDAKNRHGMPAEIDMPAEPSQAWATLWQNIRGE